MARRTWRISLDISSLHSKLLLASLSHTYTRNYYFIGTLPGIVIKLISEGKADFNGCKGPFTLPTDLSSIKDIEKIDLSSLGDRLQGRTIPSGTFFYFWRTSALFLEEFSSIRILREFSRVARRTWREFLEFSRSIRIPSLTYTCPACVSIPFHTGDIQVLGKCTQLTSVDFERCYEITGACCLEERSFSRMRPSPHLVPGSFLGIILRIFESS